MKSKIVILVKYIVATIMLALLVVNLYCTCTLKNKDAEKKRTLPETIEACGSRYSMKKGAITITFQPSVYSSEFKYEMQLLGNDGSTRLVIPVKYEDSIAIAHASVQDGTYSVVLVVENESGERVSATVENEIYVQTDPNHVDGSVVIH